MSVIIRLQNLPWSANALDIRQYFHGLSIPEGGVHIVGGEQGDAFIAFSTDEDARQAFLRSNGRIKEVQITLLLSSRTEMQKVIEQARNQSYAAFMAPQPTPAQVPPLPSAVPQIIPAPVPEIKREKDDSNNSSSSKDRNDFDRRRDKKRSRSKSRDRDRDSKKDRSKDRKDSSSRRHRDRSRSRSRDRRDRRRRDKSRSRNRSRSRDRDSSRKSRDKSRKPAEKGGNTLLFESPPIKKPMPDIWMNRPQPQILSVASQPSSLLGNFPLSFDPAKRTIDTLSVGLQAVNGFPVAAAVPVANLNTFNSNRSSPRDNWSTNQQNQNNSFSNRNSDGFQGNIRDQDNMRDEGIHRDRDRNRQRDDRDSRPPRGGNRDNYRDMNQQNQFDGGRKSRFEKFDRNINQKDLREDRSDLRDREKRDRNTEENPINTCISMEPFYGSYGDIRRFFSGLFISFKGIKIINDEYGHRTGVCYIMFANQSQKAEALRKDGDELNGIGIKIKHIDDVEFRVAIDRYNPVMDDFKEAELSGTSPPRQPKFKGRNITKYFNNSEIRDFSCLKLEDLPSFVKEQDILHIFALHPLISLHLINKPRGEHVAYAKFSSKDVAKQALEEKGNHIIGGKPITVNPCKDEEFDEVNKEHDEAMEETKQEPAITTDCLSISNLPSGKINDRDISDFFSDIGIIPTKIHLMSDNFGFTGQAYCEFETLEEAAKAHKKDSSSMGNTKITITPIKRSEMTEILNKSLPGPPAPQLPLSQPLLSQVKPQTSQMPLLQATRGGPQPRAPFRPRGPGGDANNGPAPRMFGFRGGPGGLRGGPRFGPRGSGGPMHRFPPHHNPSPNEDDAPPGCTVYMDNVPYKAGTNEILDFFDGYNCTNNVSRRYNPNNTPSAEAKVTFHTPEEAFRAVRELSGQKIWDRSIHLEQASKEVNEPSIEQKGIHVSDAKPLTIKPCKDEVDGENKKRDQALESTKQEPNIETDFSLDVAIAPTKVDSTSDKFKSTGQVDCELKPQDEAKADKKTNDSMSNLSKVVSKSRPGSPIPQPALPQLFSGQPRGGPRPPFRPRGPSGDEFGFRGGPGGPRGGPRFGPRGFGGPRQRFPPHENLSYDEDDAPRGCTVYMDNVPFNAGTNEILEFFDGYNCTHNVSKRFNPNNRPSSEAKAIFRTPQDAFRAVQELNGEVIWNRSIHLEQA